MQFDLTRVAIALDIQHSNDGMYPDSLNDLHVDSLGELPLDRFSGYPLHYERRGDGYLLYSVGPNAKDDQGTSHWNNTVNGEHVPEGSAESEAGDDLVIRMPLPK